MTVYLSVGDDTHDV